MGEEQVKPWNMFAQQNQQQVVVSGQAQGATVQDFTEGKKAANSQAQGYGANPAPVSQPPVQSVAQPVVQQTPAKNMAEGGGIFGTGQRQQQNKPAITSMDELAAAIGYTSPEQEEKLRKASVANQRILALGDALRHIGNIATTINYAPSQQFNNPVQEEYARYERGKALRDKANQTYLTYQQAKAAQDAKQRQWEMQFRYNAAKDARDYELKKGEAEARNNLREAQLNRYQTMMALDEARREGIISDNEYKRRRAELYPEEVRSRIAKNNRTGGGRSGGGGKGNTYWDYDEEGNIHYYPNKTMWEQGVESHSRGQKQQEEFKTIDGYGEQKVTYKKRPTVSKAGENASNANKKKTQPKQSQKKALPGQAPAQPQKPAKKRLPGT